MLKDLASAAFLVGEGPAHNLLEEKIAISDGTIRKLLMHGFALSWGTIQLN